MLMFLQYDGIFKEGVLSCSVRLNCPLYDTVEKDIFYCMVVFLGRDMSGEAIYKVMKLCFN